MIADDAVIPFPGFRINRLANRAQQAQRGAAGRFDRSLAGAHQSANGRGRGIKNIDLMLVDDLPEAAGGGVSRHAFKHQRRRAIGQRSVENIAMAGHPADIGGAPVDIAVMIIEDILMRHRREDEIAPRRMHDALGRARRAGGIEDE